jgi:hypothetical protein
VLVAAVLRPEEGEDGELEVVRLPLEQLADAVELPVGETERPVVRLFRDLRQGAIVPATPVGTGSGSACPVKRGKAACETGVIWER